MKTARPPGPRDRAFGMRSLRRMQRDFPGFWRDAHARYGDTVYVKFGHVDYYALRHPDQIREVLVEKAHAFVRWERHVEVLAQLHGQSLLITEGAQWRRQRRMLQPAFSPKRFEAYAGQMTGAIAAALDAMPADGTTALDFEHAMNMLAADVILRTMFGAQFGDREDERTGQVERAVRTLVDIGYREMFLPFALPAWLPFPGRAAKRAAMGLLDGLIRSHVAARRAAPATGEDLLGMLLAAVDEEDAGEGAMLDDEGVRDQLMTTFLAGHETTAAALTWAGWALSAHPEVAARAAAEVDRVLGGRRPGHAELGELVYLGMVVKEVMRRYSPSPGLLARRALEDVRIGGYLLPKGSVVSIMSVIPHQDPRWYPQPGRFDPMRFAGEAGKAIPRGAYLPFGAGPRVCIGSSFAGVEITLALAMLLQRFTLRLAPGQGEPTPRMGVSQRPEGGLRLVLEPRRASLASTVAAHAAAATTVTPQGCPFHAGA